MLIDVDVKFSAIALIFPVGDFVPEAEKIGIAPKIKITNEHATQMTEVADAAFTET